MERHAEKVQEIYRALAEHFMVSYDDAGNIERRYRRGDAIGTPYAVTIDDDTLENNRRTVRERDTMQQITVAVDELKIYLSDNLWA